MFPLKDNLPTERFPIVTVVLIAINVFVYLFLQEGLLGLPQDQASVAWPVDEYAAIPCEFTGECPDEGPATPLTAFTSMFMHGSLLHIGGNMLFLWIFGNNVEDSMGPVRYVAFYLLGGLAALAAQTAINPDAQVPTIGASGAVSAVLGGYLLLFPRARVITVIFIVFFFTIVQLPAVLVLGFWFVQQLLFGYFDLVTPEGGGGGVAYFAHIGGFAFGLLLIKVFASEQRRQRQLERAV